MSEKKTILSRPRTRVYDCNYNIGEKYYKPMVEQLDRKYSGTPIYNSSSLNSRLDDFPTRRSSPFTSDLDGLSSEPLSSRRSNFETRSLEEDLEDEIANSVRKLKALRASRSVSVDDEPSSASDIFNGVSKHKRLNFTDKILDSVGVNGRFQDSLEDEILKKRTVKLPSLFDEEPIRPFSKWSTITEPFSDDSYRQAAAARARQSKARIADIESELDAANQKSVAREKRLSNLKSLIAGEDPFLNTDSSSFRSKKLSSTLKKVTF
ncbi:hypothetical protein V9T40_011446 [Parthenolecanium corni]|uniref:Uncharacterized protein n=1 Tax=Parthenolecanium corni TaxID=536013 RepID=A0AAN9XZK2_9HEMI